MMKHKRMILLLLIVWCCIGMSLPVYATTESLTNPSSITLTRLYGNTKYDTAKVISEYYGQGKVKNVVMATGTNFADALSASVLAYERKAPIVLVDKTVQQSQEAFAYIRENLNTDGTVYIIGGTGIIPHEFDVKLMGMGFSNIVRIAGWDQYDTSAKIAGSLEESSTVVISSGEQYPDALSISSFAASRGWPILLCPQGNLAREIKEILQKVRPTKIYITGGSKVISEDVLAEIREILPQSQLERLMGQSLYDTNSLIATTFAPRATTVCISTGTNFADALAGSVVAAQTGAPILFVDPSLKTLPNGLAKYLADLSTTNEKAELIVFGGPGAVSDAIVKNSFLLLSGSVKASDVFSISDIKDTIAQGKSYSLPTTVEALQYNSDKISLPVRWNTQEVDTSKLGITVFEGIVDGYDKPVRLELTVNQPLPIAEYATHFNPSETNRTENLRLAAKAIDGKSLAPGERFSFNETVGERTVARGYKEAMIIEGNVFTLGLGGGICQVSSTLYNAVALAKLEIVERHHHSLTVGYVPPGQDATVAWPVLDFKFRNSTQNTLVIRTLIEGNALTIQLFYTK